MRLDLAERVEFGLWVQALRERKGEKLEWAAASVGLAPDYLRRIEAGSAVLPQGMMLLRLADLYGASAEEMLRRGGRLEEYPEVIEQAAAERLEAEYQHTKVCRFVRTHANVSGPITEPIKRFVVELYVKTCGRNPLECSCGGRAKR